MDEQTKTDILKSISLSGFTLEENKTCKIILARREHADNIIDRAAGLPRIRPNLVKKFNLLISKPEVLRLISPFEIRCTFCGNVISYPAWHYKVEYLINHFYYFVCFDPSTPNKVTTSCYNIRLSI